MPATNAPEPAERNWPAILALGFGIFVLGGFLFQSSSAQPPPPPPPEALKAPPQQQAKPPHAPSEHEPTPGEVARQQAAFWLWPWAQGMSDQAASAGQQ